ncbi:MAG: protein tyrosine phosphatase family protein [Gammaproteobacteria bacterium]|nr:protein tyrosine phosphatase family protein [Gammaproteobacteria bacterium]
MSTHPALADILAFQYIHENLSTSGQPSFDELALIADAGFEVVINLALTDASNVLVGEDRRVLELGMDYINLPLLFDRPSYTQALRALDTLKSLQDKKVWLHCALNMRVSSLMYMYRIHHLMIDEADAKALLSQIWIPNAEWSEIIKQLDQHYLGQLQTD